MALIDIYVKLPSGRTSSLHLRSGEKISKINCHVAGEENVPDERVILKYQGKILDRNKTVGQYGVRPETILKGEVVFPKDITVYVKLPDGRCVPVPTQNTRPVSNVKEFLESSEGIDLSKHYIKISSVRANNESVPLFSLGVQEESVLELCEKEAAAEATPSGSGQVIQETPSEELKEAVMSSFQSNGRRVEVVFSFDTTGSMSSYLETVRTNLKETCRRLLRDIPNIRIGIMAHGDYCDSRSSYTIRHIDLTSNIDHLVDFAANTPSTGGEDAPECYELVLSRAQRLDWSEDSAKALVVIGDCEPHEPSYTDQGINWWEELEVLKGMEIKIYGVYCKGNQDNAYNFYEEIAEQTDGCVLNLNHFSLITEMFLGVCYNEAAPEQLEAYTEELRQEGKLTEEAAKLMDEIAQSKPTASGKDNTKDNTAKRYVNAAWWDTTIDRRMTPSYTYVQENDTWDEYTPRPSAAKSPSVLTSTDTSTSSHSSHSPSSKRKKHKCTVM